MLKNVAKFEHKVGDRVYQFICDSDAPLGEAHDALSRFKSHVVELINAADAKDKAVKEPKPE